MKILLIVAALTSGGLMVDKCTIITPKAVAVAAQF